MAKEGSSRFFRLMCTKNNKWLSGKERGVQDRRKEARENSRCRNTLSFPAFARARKRKGREKKGASSPHFHFSKSFPSFSSSSQFWTSHRHMAGHAFAWASVCWKMIDARTVQAGHLHKFSFFGTGRTLDWTFSRPFGRGGGGGGGWFLVFGG